LISGPQNRRQANRLGLRLASSELDHSSVCGHDTTSDSCCVSNSIGLQAIQPVDHDSVAIQKTARLSDSSTITLPDYRNRVESDANHCRRELIYSKLLHVRKPFPIFLMYFCSWDPFSYVFDHHFTIDNSISQPRPYILHCCLGHFIEFLPVRY